MYLSITIVPSLYWSLTVLACCSFDLFVLSLHLFRIIFTIIRFSRIYFDWVYSAFGSIHFDFLHLFCILRSLWALRIFSAIICCFCTSIALLCTSFCSSEDIYLHLPDICLHSEDICLHLKTFAFTFTSSYTCLYTSLTLCLHSCMKTLAASIQLYLLSVNYLWCHHAELLVLVSNIINEIGCSNNPVINTNYSISLYVVCHCFCLKALFMPTWVNLLSLIQLCVIVRSCCLWELVHNSLFVISPVAYR